MDETQWRDFLREISQVILAKDHQENEDVNRPNFSPETQAAGYLGFRGATESEIAAAQARLGVQFPPSYRTFLRVSNGWPTMWHSVVPGRLVAPEAVFFLRDSDPTHVLEIYGDCGIEVSPQEHLFYRDSEPGDSGRYHAAYVPNLLCISDEGDECSLFLSPEVIDENGEWECWTFAGWSGGATRWRNFEAWFRSVLEFQLKNP